MFFSRKSCRPHRTGPNSSSTVPRRAHAWWYGGRGVRRSGQVVRARLRVAVDGPVEAIVGRMAAGRVAQRPWWACPRRLHESDVRIGDVVLAAEHQRGAATRHEHHDPDREPRQRTHAAGRRNHPGHGRGRRGPRPPVGRAGLTARDCRHGRSASSACASSPAGAGCSTPPRRRAACISSAAPCATCCWGARRASSTSSSRETSGRSPRALGDAGRGRTSASAPPPCAPATAAGTSPRPRRDLPASRRAARRAPGRDRRGPAAPRRDVNAIALDLASGSCAPRRTPR